MVDKTEKQSADEPLTLRQRIVKPMGVQAKPTLSDGEFDITAREVLVFLEAFPCYVMLVDEHHRILQANTAVRAELGVESKDIVGKYCPKVIHGIDTPWHACPLEESVQRAQPIEREAFDERSRRWIRSAIYPIQRSTADGSRIFLHLVNDITDRKRTEEQLIAANEQIRSLLLHLESVREEDRTKLAREIHDELGSLLTGLKIDLSSLTKKIPPGQESLLAKTSSMGELVDESIRAVKRISTELRPGALDDLGISDAIEWQGQEFERRNEIKCEYISNPRDIVLDRDRSTAIFRICQEALTNVVRHANATKVKVTLKKEPNRIVLTIRDNGDGIEEKHVSDPRAFGLLGMRERARPWGGEVKISGAPGKGTLVVVSIPYAGEENLGAASANRR